MSTNDMPTSGLLNEPEAESQVPASEKDAEGALKWDKYSKCDFMNVIQHIDIYGKFHTCYSEMKRYTRNSTVAISVCSRVPSDPLRSAAVESRASLPDKLRQMTMVTKTSSLYPGHDILSKRVHGRTAKPNPKSFACALVAR